VSLGWAMRNRLRSRGVYAYQTSLGEIMNVKSTLILTSGLLFLSVPAWGDSMESRQAPEPDTSIIVNISNDWSRVGQSDVKDRGGFDIEGSEHREHRHFDHDGGWDWDWDRHRDRDRDHFDSDDFPPTSNGPTPSGPTPGGPSSNPVGTPEPGSLALLLSGLFCVGSLFYRRNQSLLSSNHPAS
jgi:hypothetical protein